MKVTVIVTVDIIVILRLEVVVGVVEDMMMTVIKIEDDAVVVEVQNVIEVAVILQEAIVIVIGVTVDHVLLCQNHIIVVSVKIGHHQENKVTCTTLNIEDRLF